MDNAPLGLAQYERVVAAIKRDIRSGALQDKLPGHRGLAERYDVSLGTAQKAVRLLADQGWVTARPAVGVFVNKHLPDDESDPALSIHEELSRLRSTTEELASRIERLEKAIHESPSR